MQICRQASHSGVCLKLGPVDLQEEVFMNGTIVLPHKEIKESNLDPGTIIM
jgi:hypothetical protein